MNPFKQKLRDRRTVTLVNPDHASAGLVNFVAGLGVDAFMLDAEQGTPGFEDVENMTRAAHLHGVPALVRIPSPEPWTIERYLLRGVDGLVVPRLDTAAQVARVVRDIRYVAAKRFDRQAVVVQVESAGALAELDGFLAVPEVDCYFIGAVDLSKSLGHDGDCAHPDVMEAMLRTVRRIHRAGRCVGFLVNERDVAFWRGHGVTMLYAHVNEFVRIGWARWEELAA
jgi:2-keto-3-deoxy-L-rhamnonate aldolase RhmA